jgi:ABC transport system ATP-binding/permease protein
MNILSIDNLSKTFTDKKLINGVTLGLSKGEKIAIVGRNGAGKSTLLKIVMGLEHPDSGVIAIHKSATVGYLEQDPILPTGKKIIEVALESRKDICDAILLYEASMITLDSDDMEKAITMMDALQAWEFEDKAKRILSKLGLQDSNLEVQNLSGGQQRRVALARVLLQEPDVLLMDEPTNHLDLDMIEWLEDLLKASQQTLLFITHDRYFLDEVANGILELEAGNIQMYRTKYPEYLERKAEEELIRTASLDKVTNTLRKEAEWMRRQPKARGTKAKYRIEAFHSMEGNRDQLKEAGQGDVQLDFSSRRMGNKILELHHVNKSFGEKKILTDFNYIFRKNEKLGIIGKNGSGKTTLLQLINRAIQPDSGEIVTGETIHLGYYTQKGLTFKPRQKVIELVTEIAEQFQTGNGEELTASALLKRFLFEPSRQYEFIEKLSGGEKKRLHLLTILVRQPNFLILDEPTNDMDLSTLSVLEDYLENYKGCLIIVSHDRYFMDKLVDHLLVFEGEGVMREYPGNYTDYRYELEEAVETSRKPEVKEAAKAAAQKDSKPSTKKTFKEQQEFETLEKEIEASEQKKNELIEKLSAPDSGAKIAEWSKELEQLDKQLEIKTMRWMELSEKA